MSQISMLEQLNTQLLDDPTRINNPTFRAELEQAVQALRQQRAGTLATSEATVLKVNRPVTNPSPGTYAPSYLQVAGFKIQMAKNLEADDLSDRMALCWNFCLGVPNDLLAQHTARILLRPHM